MNPFVLCDENDELDLYTPVSDFLVGRNGISSRRLKHKLVVKIKTDL